MSETKAHAKFSASGAKRWLACPGSIKLSESAPEEKESRYAKEGTDAHVCLEYLIKNRKKRLEAMNFLRRKYPLQMIVHAEQALNVVEAWLAKMPGAELEVEIRCDLPVTLPGQFGTTDIAILDHFGRLMVIDYKYGAGIPVSVVENPQLIYYALGIAHKYDYNFAEVELVVIQPRAPIDGETIRSWVTSIETLLAWREKFEAGIQNALAPSAILLSGDHCRFCNAKVICPEIKNKALRSAQADFNDETGALALPPVKTLLPKLDRVLPALEKLEIWIDSIREYAFNFLEDGGKIRGYALVEKRGQRKWVDIDAASRHAQRAFGDKGFTAPEILSPAQMEKLKGHGETPAQFVKTYSATVSSGLTLGKDEAAKVFEQPLSMKGLNYAKNIKAIF